MQYISYEELEAGKHFPKLRSSLEKQSYNNKEKIAAFLNDGEIVLTRLSRVKDVLTGELIPLEVHAMCHGDYYWCNILSWYVEKHNLRLPKDFEEYILSQVLSNNP